MNCNFRAQGAGIQPRRDLTWPIGLLLLMQTCAALVCYDKLTQVTDPASNNLIIGAA